MRAGLITVRTFKSSTGRNGNASRLAVAWKALGMLTEAIRLAYDGPVRKDCTAGTEGIKHEEALIEIIRLREALMMISADAQLILSQLSKWYRSDLDNNHTPHTTRFAICHVILQSLSLCDGA